MLTYKNVSPIAVLCKQVSILNSLVIYRCFCYGRESTDDSCQHYRRVWQNTPEDGEAAKDKLNILVALSYHICIVNYNCELVHVSS